MKGLQALFPLFTREKELKTVWKIEKDGRRGFLAGTAHLFPYRFKNSLQKYIQKTQVVMFEAPLDEKSMDQARIQGSEKKGGPSLFGALDRVTLQKIRKHTDGLFAQPRYFPHHFLSLPSKFQDPLDLYFQSLRPWMAFFRIWFLFLKERGWIYSVDLEALEIATRLKKQILYLETIEEQVAGLEGIPLERFVNFFKQVERWEKLSRSHVQHYLRGEIDTLLSVMEGFPSRCPSIVENRDAVMFERMKGFFDRGEVIAFVGTVHIPGIRDRFAAEGYKASQAVTEEE